MYILLTALINDTSEQKDQLIIWYSVQNKEGSGGVRPMQSCNM